MQKKCRNQCSWYAECRAPGKTKKSMQEKKHSLVPVQLCYIKIWSINPSHFWSQTTHVKIPSVPIIPRLHSFSIFLFLTFEIYGLCLCQAVCLGDKKEGERDYARPRALIDLFTPWISNIVNENEREKWSKRASPKKTTFLNDRWGKKTAQICDFVTGYKCILEKVFFKKVRSWVDFLFRST